MSFNVSDFSSQISKRGLAVNNLFVLSITPPRGFGDNITTQELTFFSKSVKVPDNTIGMQGTKPIGYGPTQSYAMGMDHDTLAVEFMADAQMHVLSYFHKWQQLVYNYNSASGPLASNNGQMVYEMGYKKEYCAPTITVDVYSSHTDKIAYQFKYFNCWPMSIAHPTLSWENQAELMVIPVQFKYSNFSVSGAAPGVVSSGIGTNVSKYTSASNAIGSLLNNTGIPQFINDINQVRNAVDTFANDLKSFF